MSKETRSGSRTAGKLKEFTKRGKKKKTVCRFKFKTFSDT